MPERNHACQRCMSWWQHATDENERVMYPMKRTGERGSGQFERISWDEAIDLMAEKLSAAIEKDPRSARKPPSKIPLTIRRRCKCASSPPAIRRGLRPASARSTLAAKKLYPPPEPSYTSHFVIFGHIHTPHFVILEL